MPLRILLVVMAVGLSTLASGQVEWERTVLPANGAVLTTPSLQLSFTCGETAVGALTGTPVSLTANLGFQQGDLMVTSLDEWTTRNLPGVWPNPFHDHLVITPGPDHQGILHLLDVQGRIALEYRIQPGQQQQILRLADLPAGPYFLRWQATDDATSTSLHLIKQ